MPHKTYLGAFDKNNRGDGEPQWRMYGCLHVFDCLQFTYPALHFDILVACLCVGILLQFSWINPGFAGVSRGVLLLF
jgi:hypothetical protein